MLRRKTGLLLAACLLLLILAVQAPVSFGTPRFESSPQLVRIFGTVGHQAPINAPVRTNTAPSEPSGPDQRSPWLITALIATAAAATVCGGTYLLWRRWRHRQKRQLDRSDHSQIRAQRPVRDSDDASAHSENLRRGTESALQLLTREHEPREAITAAWLALRDQASQAGIRPLPSETPDEFALSLVDRLPGPSEDRDGDPRVEAVSGLTVLLSLYRRTRFGGETPTVDDVRSARRALESALELLT